MRRALYQKRGGCGLPGKRRGTVRREPQVGRDHRPHVAPRGEIGRDGALVVVQSAGSEALEHLGMARGLADEDDAHRVRVDVLPFRRAAQQLRRGLPTVGDDEVGRVALEQRVPPLRAGHEAPRVGEERPGIGGREPSVDGHPRTRRERPKRVLAPAKRQGDVADDVVLGEEADRLHGIVRGADRDRAAMRADGERGDQELERRGRDQAAARQVDDRSIRGVARPTAQALGEGGGDDRGRGDREERDVTLVAECHVRAHEHHERFGEPGSEHDQAGNRDEQHELEGRKRRIEECHRRPLRDRNARGHLPREEIRQPKAVRVDEQGRGDREDETDRGDQLMAAQVPACRARRRRGQERDRREADAGEHAAVHVDPERHQERQAERPSLGPVVAPRQDRERRGEEEEREELRPDHEPGRHRHEGGEDGERAREGVSAPALGRLPHERHRAEPEDDLESHQTGRTRVPVDQRHRTLGQELVIHPGVGRGGVGEAVLGRERAAEEKRAEEQVTPEVGVGGGGDEDRHRRRDP